MMSLTTIMLKKHTHFLVFENKIIEIINNYENNPSLSIELCKTIIEDICKSILDEQDIEYETLKSFSQLVSKTFEILRQGNSDDDSLSDLIRRITGVMDYIGVIRNNNCNFASHGKGLNHNPVTPNLALLSIYSTDAVLGFLLSMYKHNIHRKDCYEDYVEFNEYLDSQFVLKETVPFGISISKALFEQDKTAYIEVYNDYLNNLNEE